MMVAVCDRRCVHGMVPLRQTRMKPLVGTGLPRSRSVQAGASRAVKYHLHRFPRCPQGDRRTSRDLLRSHRDRLGTRRGARALGVFKQAVLVLRWFVDGTRLVQLARDNGISLPTSCR